jgi:hypothetical protein
LKVGQSRAQRFEFAMSAIEAIRDTRGGKVDSDQIAGTPAVGSRPLDETRFGEQIELDEGLRWTSRKKYPLVDVEMDMDDVVGPPVGRMKARRKPCLASSGNDPTAKILMHIDFFLFKSRTVAPGRFRYVLLKIAGAWVGCH